MVRLSDDSVMQEQKWLIYYPHRSRSDLANREARLARFPRLHNTRASLVMHFFGLVLARTSIASRVPRVTALHLGLARHPAPSQKNQKNSHRQQSPSAAATPSEHLSMVAPNPASHSPPLHN